MNLPGQGDGHWEWRFGWSQVQPLHAERLRGWEGFTGGSDGRGAGVAMLYWPLNWW